MDNQEIQYEKGFNSGYTLAKYEPDLLSKIVKDLRPATGYLDGFFSGKEEFELERFHEQLKALHEVRDRSKSQENEIEKDSH